MKKRNRAAFSLPLFLPVMSQPDLCYSVYSARRSLTSGA